MVEGYKNRTNLINPIDLYMYYFGTQQCLGGHSFGPALKDHFKIHYIHKGKGIFKVGDKTYNLGKGQGFLICPNVIVNYVADNEDPWAYSWIEFNGRSILEYLTRANLSIENPIFSNSINDAITRGFEEMIKANEDENKRDLILNSMFYIFLANLIDNSNIKQIAKKSSKMKAVYIDKVIEFIQINYSHKVTVSEISSLMHLNSKYLSQLFKEEVGVTIKEYIITYRIEKACDLIKDERLSIGDVSRSIGYDDQLLFSRMFKRVKGISPRKYRSAIFDHY
jgi:AraC-like DNA-binding protein